MKYSKFLLVTLCFFFLFNGKKYEQAVIDRLSVPVKVCLEGQDCGSAAQASQSVADVASAEVKKVELSEGSEHRNDKYHGKKGPLKIERSSNYGILEEAFIKSAVKSRIISLVK